MGLLIRKQNVFLHRSVGLMTLILSAIVIVAVVTYFSFFYIQRKNNSEIEEKKEQINNFVNSTIHEEFNSTEKIKLAGDSLAQFEETKQNYLYMVNHKLPQLSEHLTELSDANTHYRFFEVRRELKLIEMKLQNATKVEKDTKNTLELLKKDNLEHQKKTKELEQKYQKIRKTLLAKNFSFGPSIDKLEENLSEIEKTFDNYSEMAKVGDYVKSAEILKTLKKETVLLETAIKVVPPLYRNVKNIFPEQVTEIKDGYEKLVMDNFGFKTNFEKKITDIQTLIASDIVDLSELNFDEAKTTDEKIDQKINEAYDELELEIKSKKSVQSRLVKFEKFIKHARKNQKELLAELNRLNQNYTFNHNEMESAQEINESLEIIEKEFVEYKEKSENRLPIVYSDIDIKQQQQVKELGTIEEKQAKIADGIQGLWEDEQKAHKAVKLFDLDIHTLKRNLEKLNLPGLSKEYLDYFYAVNSEIDDLADKLAQTKIDMDEITKLLIDTQSDLDVLSEKTNDILDSASLTERLLQYANRYRLRYPEIADAATEADSLFNREYNYSASLEKIATAVDNVEAGAYKKIEDDYYASKIQTPVK
ncbi:septation ring formation regulator EzrA [Liquorilactobacillus cacaonum DSM 21116]|uniref:Septation ring formation regulator EzrA n=2 Tax=Liquorilactobacillus cacaonum TaxID=483012 RepID=A0A0R2CGR8_9LACO|nr:septation ring formation regulator EzrA [Liquorilactobacillus cacaonum DSM 21116]